MLPDVISRWRVALAVLIGGNSAETGFGTAEVAALEPRGPAGQSLLESQGDLELHRNRASSNRSHRIPIKNGLAILLPRSSTGNVRLRITVDHHDWKRVLSGLLALAKGFWCKDQKRSIFRGRVALGEADLHVERG
jgi:hypothetical protein